MGINRVFERDVYKFYKGGYPSPWTESSVPFEPPVKIKGFCKGLPIVTEEGLSPTSSRKLKDPAIR